MNIGDHVRDSVTGFEGRVTRIDKAGIHVLEDGLSLRSRGGQLYAAPPSHPQTRVFLHNNSARLRVLPFRVVHKGASYLRLVKS